MRSAIGWINGYRGSNILLDPTKEVEEELKERFGQGFGGTAADRKKVENRAMTLASQHYMKAGYRVKPVGKPYDLLCTRSGRILYVEVKGTRSIGEKVLLTPNEVCFAESNEQQMALAVVTNIELRKKGRGIVAVGGKLRVTQPWRLKRRALEPVSYWLSLVG